MQTTTRLLLPFLEEINAAALDYAVQLAEQSASTLVPLALIPIKPGKSPRLELIQQAQDFLVFIQRKAERRGVPIELSQVYTQDAARSIEAFAGEMDCEAVILFLGNTREALLNRSTIRTLLDHAACNMYIGLLPEKRSRSHPLYVSLFRHADERQAEFSSELPHSDEQRHPSFFQRITRL